MNPGKLMGRCWRHMHSPALMLLWQSWWYTHTHTGRAAEEQQQQHVV